MNASSLLLPPLLALLAGCVTLSKEESSPQAQERAFNLQYLAKTDVDLVTESHQQSMLEGLRQLADQLYRRNPRQLARGGFVSAEQAVERIFAPQRTEPFPQLHGRTSIEAIQLAFEAGYTGDRVLAYIEGLRSMILLAYENKTEFFILDRLDPQKLYNSARNIEAAAWFLDRTRDPGQRPYLESHECVGPVHDIGIERTFGKLIAIQDNMARIVADSTHRQIKNVIQTVASMVFLPI